MSNNNNETMNPKNLRVPNSSAKTGVKSIMDAYNSQSKIQLFDENTAMSSNEVDGVKAKNIPLSALRPKQPIGEDENGKPVYSKSQYAEDMARRAEIRKAYARMNGEETDESEECNDESSTQSNRFENVQEAEIEYIEDVPNDNEGLLNYLETCINNASANLEMLKSLYAALR